MAEAEERDLLKLGFDISKIEEYIERFPHEEHIYETLQRET